MGMSDAKSEIEKISIHSSKSELKTATIRTTGSFLDVLTHVSEKMGISRQSSQTLKPSRIVWQLTKTARSLHFRLFMYQQTT